MNSSTDVRAILLVGPTGSGKTPVGDWLEQNGLHGQRCHHFDFGHNLRAVAAGSDVAFFTSSEIQFIRDVLEKGALLENDRFYLAEKILQSFMARRLKSSQDLIILNGLPRHSGQAEAVAVLVNIVAVVSLECSPEVVLERIQQNSGGDRTDRPDDEIQMVRRKLAIFSERTQLLIDHYRHRDVPVFPVQVGVFTRPEDVASQINI